MLANALYDVVSMGEMIVDFTQCGTSANGYAIYEQNPGGGAANIAVSVARLGGNVAFLGKVGNDLIGTALVEALRRENVDISALVLDDCAKTFLAFVHTDERGERSFSFYGENPAHLRLRPEELNLSLLENGKILAYGDKILANPRIFETTKVAVETARASGAKIAFDPNIRLSLWTSEKLARETVLAHLPMCDFVKLSSEELFFLTEQNDIKEGVKRIFLPGMQLLTITDGENGAAIYTKDDCVSHPGYAVRVVDTTGAGDSFWGSMILQIAQRSDDKYSHEDLYEMLAFSCACGALATTKRGAVPAMPTLTEALAFMNR